MRYTYYSYSQRSRRLTSAGGSLLYTMMFLAFLAGSLGMYQKYTSNELSLFSSSKQSMETFYASEAALNIRAEELLQLLRSNNSLSGTSPSGLSPCVGGNNGSGDLGCKRVDLTPASAFSFVERIGDTVTTQVPPGEKFEGLTATVDTFRLQAVGVNRLGQSGSRSSSEVEIRRVPLFQFGALFENDLEFYPGPRMEFGGAVHTNANLYLASENQLRFGGQVTVAEDLRCGMKFNIPYYFGGLVRARTYGYICGFHAGNQGYLAPPGLLQRYMGTSVMSQVGRIEYPPVEEFEAIPGGFFWDNSDLRIVLNLNESDPTKQLEVRDAANLVRVPESQLLRSSPLCADAVDPTRRAVTVSSGSFLDRREGTAMTLMEVDVGLLLNCLHLSGGTPEDLLGGSGLGDATFGGLGIYLTIDGPLSSASQSTYGVRLKNGQVLAASVPGAPALKGVTFVTDQPLYVQGDYNTPPSPGQPIPAALMADAINVLSNNWGKSADNLGDLATAATTVDRRATATTVQAAMISGFVPSGMVNGEAGHNLMPESGGLHNYMRLHEDWSGVELRYVGSLTSLYLSRHVNGAFQCCGVTYNAPDRNYGFDNKFLDITKLPPLTPIGMYLKQAVFERQY